MSSKTSPFFGINYGWSYGEDGWNGGMDYNLKALSFLSTQAINGVVTSLPLDPVEGDSYIVGSSLNVFIDSEWLTISPEDGFVVRNKTTGKNLKFSGTVWEEVASSQSIKVAFIGDSLTQSSTRNEGWADQLCSTIEGLTGASVLRKNLAIGGTTWAGAVQTKSHNGGTETQLEAAVKFAPDLLFISLGINDTIYAAQATPAQIQASATTIKTQILAANPNCKIVYVEQLCHNIGLGISPVSLTNKDCLPFSHNLVSLNGLSSVRVNDTLYLDRSVSPATLTAYQNWASATLLVRGVFDGQYLSADLWKMARLGGMVDGFHVDELSHCLWAWKVVKYLATSNFTIKDVSFDNLNFSNINSYIVDIDALWDSLQNITQANNMSASYRGQSFSERMAGWFYYNPRSRMDYTNVLRDATVPVTVNVTGVSPNREVYVSWDGANFSLVGNSTPQGVHLQTFIPGYAFPSTSGSGVHKIRFAVANPDGSFDAYIGDVSIVFSGNTSLRSLSSNITGVAANSIYNVAFTSTPIDGLGVGSQIDRITIPANLSGRKIRLKGNIRVTVPLSSAAGFVDVYAGIQKNGSALNSNSLATGLGVASSRALFSNNTGNAVTPGFDLNFCSAVMTAAPGDYYQMNVLVSGSTVSGPSTILASNFTWFEIELL